MPVNHAGYTRAAKCTDHQKEKLEKAVHWLMLGEAMMILAVTTWEMPLIAAYCTHTGLNRALYNHAKHWLIIKSLDKKKLIAAYCTYRGLEQGINHAKHWLIIKSLDNIFTTCVTGFVYTVELLMKEHPDQTGLVLRPLSDEKPASF